MSEFVINMLPLCTQKKNVNPAQPERPEYFQTMSSFELFNHKVVVVHNKLICVATFGPKKENNNLAEVVVEGPAETEMP